MPTSQLLLADWDANVAGADLAEMVHFSTAEAHKREYLKDLSDSVSSMTKPTVAAVVGLAVSTVVSPCPRINWLLLGYDPPERRSLADILRILILQSTDFYHIGGVAWRRL